MDDIISRYLKPKEGEKAKSSAAVNSPQNDDIIKKYLKPSVAASSEPSVPISALGPQGGSGGTENGLQDQSSSLLDVGKNAALRTYNAAKEGVLTAGSGIGEALSGKPASGVGKIGLGALQVAGAPFEAVSSVGSDITGSEDAGNRLGFIAGALPIAKAGQAVAASLPRNKALATIVDKITSNGRDPQALADTIDAMKADSRIGPADKSPAVLNMTQKLFTTEGDAAKNYLYNASKSRVANLPQDVKAAYDVAGGVPVNVVQKLADLSAASKKVGSDMINPALAKAKPVDISSTLESIDNVLKPGVLKIGDSVPLTAVKNELADIQKSLRTSKEYNAEDLHKFQSGLRVTAQNMMNSADGNTRGVGQALMDVRNDLVNDINKVAPGYKEGLSAYKDEKDIADAFRHAHDDVFSKSTKMENAPEVTEQWFNKLSDHEKEAAKEGARLAVRSKMGASDNATLAGTNFAKSEFNQKKLETIFGKEETGKLLTDLEHTRAIKNTDQKITEGSQTEMRRAGDQSIALPVKGENSLMPYAIPAGAELAGTLMGAPGVGAVLGTGAVLAKGAVSSAKHAIETKLAKERNLHLAKMALPVEGPDRAKLISDLQAFLPQPKQSLLSRVAIRLPISP